MSCILLKTPCEAAFRTLCIPTNGGGGGRVFWFLLCWYCCPLLLVFPFMLFMLLVFLGEVTVCVSTKTKKKKKNLGRSTYAADAKPGGKKKYQSEISYKSHPTYLLYGMSVKGCSVYFPVFCRDWCYWSLHQLPTSSCR